MTDPWFDTHVHLDSYSPEEQIALLGRADANGVGAMVTIGEVTEGIADAPAVYRAVGVHPKRADQYGARCEEIAEAAMQSGVVAIGETGFDREGPPLDVQYDAFREQVALARERDLAVVLHIDDDWDRIVGHLRALTGVRVVRHYFRGSPEEAEWHADRGHYLSLGRPLLKLPHLEPIVAAYPAGLLVIETDSYALPGRTTEPRDIDTVGEGLARMCGWSVDECRRRLWANSLRAFRL